MYEEHHMKNGIEYEDQQVKNNIELMPLKEDYCESVYHIAVESLREHWSLNSVKGVLKYDNNIFYVARQKQTGEIVGYAGIMIIVDEAELLSIAVAPSYRKNGIGQLLIEFLLNIAKEQGAVRMLLEVRKSNENARNLYEKNGFCYLAERKGYYSNPKEDAIIMEKRY